MDLVELNENNLPVIDKAIKIVKVKERIGRYRKWRKNNTTSKNYDVAGDTLSRLIEEYGRLLLDREILLSKMAENKQ